jgi:hypothetical protein
MNVKKKGIRALNAELQKASKEGGKVFIPAGEYIGKNGRLVRVKQKIRDKVAELKEMVDWHRMMIGPKNADRLKIRIDDLFRSAVRHGKMLAQKR